jgi:flavin reductase (DIM6/NTAB) family NADH-FMN oxidoreductase RutF
MIYGIFTLPMKIQIGPQAIMFPVPPALITCAYEGEYNIITVGAVSMVSAKPPMISVAIRPQRHSYEMIREAGEFAVNMPAANLYVEVDYCGVMSGRNIDKFDELHLTSTKGIKINSPLIQECPFNYECILKDVLDIHGTNALFIGEVVEIHVDKDKTRTKNDATIPDLSKMDPLVYSSGTREYWHLGEKIGDAYSAWKEFKKK